jgi:hypothetical protein
MAKQARIRGRVEYREGDGPTMPIPTGPCEIEETELDATISWVDGNTRDSAALPIADFRRYVKTKAIEILD